jgi:hypothetical protein
MTESQKLRVEFSIVETESILKKAKRYSVDLQDKNLIATYEGHLARLQKMLVTGVQ